MYLSCTVLCLAMNFEMTVIIIPLSIYHLKNHDCWILFNVVCLPIKIITWIIILHFVDMLYQIYFFFILYTAIVLMWRILDHYQFMNNLLNVLLHFSYCYYLICGVCLSLSILVFGLSFFLVSFSFCYITWFFFIWGQCWPPSNLHETTLCSLNIIQIIGIL